MVPVVDVIHVIAVGHSFMPAAFGVHMGVVLMGNMRQVMLVIMAFVRDMRVPLVDVVNVTLMRDSGVPALRPADRRRSPRGSVTARQARLGAGPAAQCSAVRCPGHARPRPQQPADRVPRVRRRRVVPLVARPRNARCLAARPRRFARRSAGRSPTTGAVETYSGGRTTSLGPPSGPMPRRSYASSG